MVGMLNMKPVMAYTLQPQTSRAMKRYNRTLARDIPNIIYTRPDDWDEHKSPARFQYNISLYKGTGTTP